MVLLGVFFSCVGFCWLRGIVRLGRRGVVFFVVLVECVYFFTGVCLSLQYFVSVCVRGGELFPSCVFRSD